MSLDAGQLMKTRLITTSKNSLYLVYFLVFSIEALQKY